MDYRDLKKLVRQGEGQHLEFKLKANHPEKIVREAVAFANSEGGVLLVGVADDKSIQGLKFAIEDEYVLTNALNKYCFPNLKYDLIKIPLPTEREILAFIIEKSDKVHYVIEDFENRWGKAYIRVNDQSVQASREMREILRGQRRKNDVQFNYGEKEQFLMRYLEAHQKITVNEFSHNAQIPLKVASRTLVLLVLAQVLQINPNPRGDCFVFSEQQLALS
jgi:hypothetical protein